MLLIIHVVFFVAVVWLHQTTVESYSPQILPNFIEQGQIQDLDNWRFVFHSWFTGLIAKGTPFLTSRNLWVWLAS